MWSHGHHLKIHKPQQCPYTKNRRVDDLCNTSGVPIHNIRHCVRIHYDIYGCYSGENEMGYVGVITYNVVSFVLPMNLNKILLL